MRISPRGVRRRLLTAAFALVPGLTPGPVVTGATTRADRLQQYLKLAEATSAQPIAPAELDAALLSPAGIEDIAVLFESALAGRLVTGGTPVTPELGGEATLDEGRLRFVAIRTRCIP
jgi:hypothetical protein